MINKEWSNYLKEEFEKEYFINLKNKLKEEDSSKTILPPPNLRLNSLILPPSKVKVVILGQDPYHGINQANGLAFSVQDGIKIPPSLANIYKEIEKEYNIKMSESGNLIPWVNQGVLLLNSVMTVELSSPASHKNIGWEKFTDKIISTLSDNFENIVFLLWGKFAESKKILIDNKKHLILISAHPSPFSCHKFFGNNHFIETNNYLIKNNKTPINWKI